MHIHILGICGTFMGSLALLAREAGHVVTGADQNVYPPMSDQLEAAGIELYQGYDAEHIAALSPDSVIIGNALSRGNPSVEYVLDEGLHYQSGPEWLSEHVLRGRWVLAVAGTHGKTTTASMLAWILSYAGLEAGYLIGGVPSNFGQSARLGSAPYFVIEADEYDTAFFDKRSKFVHYHPQTLVINNLEFDHADIFDDLAAIQRQMHHLIRTVPAKGQVMIPNITALNEVMDMGCWSTLEYLSGAQSPWRVSLEAADQSTFNVAKGEDCGQVQWTLCGAHNRDNALAAIAAAHHIGVSVSTATAALCEFTSVKRRMERLACVDGVTVYDDFAHHPSAIKTTLAGMRARCKNGRVIAIIEPRSNTMRMGCHSNDLPVAVADADCVWWYESEENSGVLKTLFIDNDKVVVRNSISIIIEQVVAQAQAGDEIVIMSNGSFGGIHTSLISALEVR
jgi:UDP-N-acetylmuramate: L-alanyl-gamma-D-glutamyl-meso-diaminopimelate ligase